jgi:hypothetical protein
MQAGVEKVILESQKRTQFQPPNGHEKARLRWIQALSEAVE